MDARIEGLLGLALRVRDARVSLARVEDDFMAACDGIPSAAQELGEPELGEPEERRTRRHHGTNRSVTRRARVDEVRRMLVDKHPAPLTREDLVGAFPQYEKSTPGHWIGALIHSGFAETVPGTRGVYRLARGKGA